MPRFKITQHIATIFSTEVEADSEQEARDLLDHGGIDWLCEADPLNSSDISIEQID